MSEYDLSSIKLPRLTGTPLSAFAKLLESPASRSLLIGKVLKDAGVERFRARTLHETPTFLPLWTEEQETTPPNHFNIHRILDSNRREQNGYTPISVRDFFEAYRTGRKTPLEVAQALLEVVERSNQGQRALRAVIAIQREDVLKQAEASTARFQSGRPFGPLDGVPIGVKDEIDQAPYATSVGTSFIGQQKAKEDATIVARLRAAGALLFGKLNMNQIGINPTSANVHFGVARNPQNLEHEAGGSSSGSAAAVGAGLCPIAIGADGGGSIRIPAAHCGLVGLKSTFGRISEHGAFPLAWTVGHLGPLAATAEDAALAYAVIAGADPKDALSLHQPHPSLDDWYRNDLGGIRIGIYDAWFDHANSEIVRACRSMVDVFCKAGAVVKSISIPELESMRVAHAITILSEMNAALKAYAENLSELSPATRLNLSLGRALSAQDYVHAQRMRARAIHIFKTAMAEVDVIATPACAVCAPLIPVDTANEDWSDLTSVTEVMRYVVPGNLTGLPAISFPVAYDAKGLPIGMQIMGHAWSEDLLLRFAKEAETAFKRNAPQAQFSVL